MNDFIPFFGDGSALRCKAGDMAVILVGRFKGQVLTCVRLEDPVFEQGRNAAKLLRGKTWFVDRLMPWGPGGRLWDDSVWIPYCPDAALMPITPPDNFEDTQEIKEHERPKPATVE
jgi:hypothetical protein